MRRLLAPARRADVSVACTIFIVPAAFVLVYEIARQPTAGTGVKPLMNTLTLSPHS